MGILIGVPLPRVRLENDPPGPVDEVGMQDDTCRPHRLLGYDVEAGLDRDRPENWLDVVPRYETQCGELLLHPDLADPLRGIVLEADSWTWHAEKWDHDRDCARYNAMTVAGWLVLRFTWDHAMHSPEYVVRSIRGLLAESARAA